MFNVHFQILKDLHFSMRNSNKTETMGMVLTAGDGDDLEYSFSDWDVFCKSYESTNKSLFNNLNLTRV